MCRFQSLANTLCDIKRFIRRNRASPDPLRQHLALNELKYQETRIAGFLKVIYRTDIGMVQ